MPSLNISLVVDDKGNIVITKTKQNLEGLNSEATKLGTTFTTSFSKIQTSALAASAAIAAISYGVIRLGKQFMDAALAMERINASIKASVGSATAAATELQFLHEESTRLGLSFQDTALSYSKFMAATRGTSVEGEKARKIFSQMSEGITALKLTTDEANGIFLAMSQMFSKGKVQAEEFRGQLGERLPGAFNMAAKAMGITTAELDKMLKDGTVIAADMIPKLAQEIHNTYGKAAADAARQGQAEINRFNNAIFETKAMIGTELKPVLLDILKFIQDSLPVIKGAIYYTKIWTNELAALIDKWMTMGRYYKTVNGMLLGAMFNTDNFKNMKKELDEINMVLEARNKAAQAQYYGAAPSSQRSAVDIAAENARNAARAAAEQAASMAEANKKAAKEAERLAEKWDDLRRNLEAQIEMSGMDELARRLRQNQLEADRLNDSMERQPEHVRKAAAALIDQLKQIKDIQDTFAVTERIVADQWDYYTQGDKAETDRVANLVSSYERLKDALDPMSGVINERNDAQAILNSMISQFAETMPEYAAEIEKVREQFETQWKSNVVQKGLQGFSEGLAGVSRLYKDGSKDAETWMQAANALIVVQKGLALVDAVTAVASAATAPWPINFAAMATMAAAMGSLLSSIGMTINGSSSSSGSTPEPYQSTTVLGGASGEASKSIQNALSLLNDVNGESYVELVGIHRNMRELNNNITGLVRSLLQSGGSYQTFISNISLPSEMAYGSGTGKWFKDIPGLDELEDFGDAIMDAIGGFFGVGTSSKMTQQGIQLAATTIGDLLNNIFVEGLYYSVVQTKKKDWLGHVSRRTRTYYEEMDDDTERMFNLIYQGIAQGLMDIGTALGQDTTKIVTYAFEQQRINLQGLNPNEYEDAITAWMNELADTATSALFGDFLSSFQELGEGLYETAIRIITDKEIILDALQMTGQQFRGTTEDLVYFSEALIDMAGDLDTLQGYFDSYSSAFLSEAQRNTLLREKLVGIMDYENLVLPQTRDAYADLVASLDLMTDSGQSAYYTLLALSDAADEYYSYLEKQSENIVDTLSGYVDKLQSAKDKLLGTTDQATSFQSGLQQLRDVMAQIQAGSYNGLAGIDGALNAVTSISKDAYSSYLDYQRDYYKALGVITQLESATSSQLTEWQAINETLQTNHDEDIDVAMAQLRALMDIQSAITGTAYTPHIGSFEGGGTHSGGWRVVGENGPELEYTGPSTIFSNERSKGLVDISPLGNKLDKLIERVEVGNAAMASSLKKIETAFSSVTDGASDGEDNPAIRVVAN